MYHCAKNCGYGILLPAALSLTLGCLPFVNPVQHPDPKIATMYDAPPIYSQWWATVESCAHKKKNMQHLRWYAVMSPYLDEGWERAWLPMDDDNIVYIRIGRKLDRDEVIAAMVDRRFTHYKAWSGDADEEAIQRILACAGVSNPTCDRIRNRCPGT